METMVGKIYCLQRVLLMVTLLKKNATEKCMIQIFLREKVIFQAYLSTETSW